MLRPELSSVVPLCAAVLCGLATGACAPASEAPAQRVEPSPGASTTPPNRAEAGELSASQARPDPGQIRRQEALTLIEEGAVLLDVRTQREFDAGALEGAVLIPHTQVGDRIAEIRALAGEETPRAVVVYCRSGRRSGLAARELDAAGFEVVNGGGYRELQAALKQSAQP